MEKNKDYEKRLGIRLREAYLKDYEGPAMSREEFHRLIEAAEKKEKHKRTLIGIAAACVALCLVCGGFVAGISMRESASAGKDDETKTVQQGGNVVIGSGVSENDQNVGVSTKTYTNIEDIPEDLREQIRFLDSDEFELEKVKVYDNGLGLFILYYSTKEGDVVKISQEKIETTEEKIVILADKKETFRGYDVFFTQKTEGTMYSFCFEGLLYNIMLDNNNIKIETVLCGLIV